MLLDSQNEFANSQAVTVSAYSANVIDLGKGRDIGNGEDLYLVVQVDQQMTDGAGNTYTCTPSLRTDDTLNGGNLNSGSTLMTLATIAANSPAGAQVIAKLPPGFGTYKKYLQVYFATSGTLTAGKFSAFLTKDIQSNGAYASGFSIQ